MRNFNRLWERALSHLEEELPMFQFNVWIKELKPIHEENSVYLFEVSNPVHQSMMSEKYSDQIIAAIKDAAQELEGGINEAISLSFLIPQEASNLKISEIEPEEVPQKKTDSNLNPNFTFDTFVVGESNQFANAAAHAVAQSPGKAYNPLFLYGGVGLGKTHLMHAVGNEIIKSNPDANIVYVSSETFTNELIRMIQLTNNNTNVDLREQFRNKYRKVDVLMIDDIQFISGKDVTQDEFFHTFNALHEINKQIIISSDKPPREMEKLEERIRSRFEAGIIADIKSPDYETRVAILMKKAQLTREQNPEILPIKNEVFHFMAEQPNTNIRTLEGALQRVFMYAELHKDLMNIKSIDLDIARRALEDYFSLPTIKIITPTIVVDVVSSYYDVKKDDLLGSKKNKEFAFPRQIAMYLMRDMTNLSNMKIAEFFGKKDHTTIMYAYEKIRKLMKEDLELRKVVEDIINKIKG